MGEPYLSDFDISHERLYAEMERLKSENYHLKRQLRKKNDRLKGQDNYIGTLEKKLRHSNKDQQHYRNGRKRGAYGFKG
jgi:hypothetical protein